MRYREVTDVAARLAVTAVMIINMVLTMKGRNPLPFDENTLTESLSASDGGCGSDLELVEEQQSDSCGVGITADACGQ